MHSQRERADDNELHILMNEGIYKRPEIGMKVHSTSPFLSGPGSMMRPVF
jgi:hypothetical protein